MERKIYSEPVFLLPFTCIMTGASQSGKTRLFFEILLKENIFDKKPDRIIYCYSEYQPIFTQYKELLNIEFHEGMIDMESINKDNINLIVYDDLMINCSNENWPLL